MNSVYRDLEIKSNENEKRPEMMETGGLEIQSMCH